MAAILTKLIFMDTYTRISKFISIHDIINLTIIRYTFVNFDYISF